MALHTRTWLLAQYGGTRIIRHAAPMPQPPLLRHSFSRTRMSGLGNGSQSGSGQDQVAILQCRCSYPLASSLSSDMRQILVGKVLRVTYTNYSTSRIVPREHPQRVD